jgi:hypothetical protein
MEAQGRALSEALQELKGVRLYSVEFVMDYVQLHFGGPILTAYTHPSLNVRGRSITWETDGFRDLLCELIEVPVVEAHVVAGEELRLHFENGAIFAVSLQDKDYGGPEAVEFISNSGPSWIV